MEVLFMKNKRLVKSIVVILIISFTQLYFVLPVFALEFSKAVFIIYDGHNEEQIMLGAEVLGKLKTLKVRENLGFAIYFRDYRKDPQFWKKQGFHGNSVMLGYGSVDPNSGISVEKLTNVKDTNDAVELLYLWMKGTQKDLDFRKWKCVRTLKGHQSEILDMDVNRDESLLASIDKNSYIRLWDLNNYNSNKIIECDINKKIKNNLPEYAYIPSKINLRKDRETNKDLILATNMDNMGWVFELPGGIFKGYIDLHYHLRESLVKYDKNHKIDGMKEYLAGINGIWEKYKYSDDNSIMAFNHLFSGIVFIRQNGVIKTYTKIAQTGVKHNPIRDFDISIDNRMLATLHRGRGYIWDMSDGSLITTLDIRKSGLDGLSGCEKIFISPDSKKVIVTGKIYRNYYYVSDAILIYHTSSGSIISSKIINKNVLSSSQVFSQDSASVLVGCKNGEIRIFDSNTLEQVQVLSDHKGSINKLLFLKDGKRLLSASKDGTIKVWMKK